MIGLCKPGCKSDDEAENELPGLPMVYFVMQRIICCKIAVIIVRQDESRLSRKLCVLNFLLRRSPT